MQSVLRRLVLVFCFRVEKKLQHQTSALRFKNILSATITQQHLIKFTPKHFLFLLRSSSHWNNVYPEAEVNGIFKAQTGIEEADGGCSQSNWEENQCVYYFWLVIFYWILATFSLKCFFNIVTTANKMPLLLTRAYISPHPPFWTQPTWHTPTEKSTLAKLSTTSLTSAKWYEVEI